MSAAFALGERVEFVDRRGQWVAGVVETIGNGSSGDRLYMVACEANGEPVAVRESVLEQGVGLVGSEPTA